MTLPSLGIVEQRHNSWQSCYSRSDLHPFQQLIDLFVRHLLAQLRKDVSELACSNEAVALFIEDLETTDELLCMTRYGDELDFESSKAIKRK